MSLKIVISSGKGGTGKTFIATNLARTAELLSLETTYLDCDVEAPNGHLFLKPELEKEQEATVLSPLQVDPQKCTLCGQCAKVCQSNALAVIKDRVLIFKNLCHLCGACLLVCQQGAIIEKPRKIGLLQQGISGKIKVHYALLETGEGAMAPPLIRKVKAHTGQGFNIIDSPPGTSCSVIETVKDADLAILVTDPTPFGINDLKLAVDMCRKIGQEPVVIINRSEYFNHDLLLFCEKENLEVIGEIPDERKIAECYSNGQLAVEKLPLYQTLFKDLFNVILKTASRERKIQALPQEHDFEKNNTRGMEGQPRVNSPSSANVKELVIISGKGGTGKTTLTAGFCALAENIAISDCDVDAADLHLILKPEIKERGRFSGSQIAVIDPQKCTLCRACYQKCQYEAIQWHEQANCFTVNELSCEGCAVCRIVCQNDAVSLLPRVNGEWYHSVTRFGPMSHAKLGIAGENSGKLVSLVRNKKNELAVQYGIKNTIIDGSPGTGCPVIASLTGADYAVIITEPTVSGIHDLERILEVTRHFKIDAGVIVNKYDLNPGQSRQIKEIARHHKIDFLGKIPYDKQMTRAQIKGLSIVEYSKNSLAAHSIRKIWNNINTQLFD